jgi:hypothetical protein
MARGVGMRQDKAEGIGLLRRACQKGSGFGCDKLHYLGG